MIAVENPAPVLSLDNRLRQTGKLEALVQIQPGARNTEVEEVSNMRPINRDFDWG